MYDQLGCGKSTHLQHLKGDTSFWTVELFLAELANLLSALNITSYSLLGQSWGGMLGSEHAVLRPACLHSLIIADSPASMQLWIEAANELREKLPKEVNEVLRRCERDGTTDSKEYENAMEVFYSRHVCRTQPKPWEMEESDALLKADNTVYLTMLGPFPSSPCLALSIFTFVSLFTLSLT
jgi:L-proline amide hydrolase